MSRLNRALQRENAELRRGADGLDFPAVAAQPERTRPGRSARFESRDRFLGARGDAPRTADPSRFSVRQGSRSLPELAARTVDARGLLSYFSGEAMNEVNAIHGPALLPSDGSVKDLTQLCMVSIDNGSLDPATRELVGASKDLDQLTYAEKLPNGNTKVLVAIADVDALVPKGTAIDRHSAHNTRTVYTPGRVFPMIPDRLSTDLTSLNPGVDRLTIITEMEIDPHGRLMGSSIYRGMVNNHGKLAYESVAAWLQSDSAPIPLPIEKDPAVGEQVRLQNTVSTALRARRFEQGAVQLAESQSRVVFKNGQVSGMEAQRRNQASELIEELMVAANGVSARFLEANKVPALARIVRDPERWDRIRELAQSLDDQLPVKPSSLALSQFLERQRGYAPLAFADLSLAVLKLMGRGEYVVRIPGKEPEGHFGLAVRDYAHSTAPNRRRPDLIVQRQIKAVLAGKGSAYTAAELEVEAGQCSVQEAAVQKVERQVNKCAAAMLLEKKIGQRFSAVVTGSSDRGTWVRISHPAVEGRMVHGGGRGLAVGERVQVRLVHTDVERGFIDFSR